MTSVVEIGGGRWIGIAKIAWSKACLVLDDDRDIVQAFISYGEGRIPS